MASPANYDNSHHSDNAPSTLRSTEADSRAIVPMDIKPNNHMSCEYVPEAKGFMGAIDAPNDMECRIKISRRKNFTSPLYPYTLRNADS
ncbi:hypothetical protein L6452_27148 [Arctium lappa]|uniref:Uncharacterized protein n=1 Tax=Arctium lappa TaxID=4217 RepID=A0ACB8ZUW6_ARCLA|nr:hypothetical protein L6452_27148 [Arctium lappa]